MTWVRLDDGFYDHPKVLRISDRAFRLWICSIGYCGRHLTDGVLPEEAAPGLLPGRGLASVIAELLEARLWEKGGSGYTVHDFLKYNPTRVQVDSKRDANTKRQAEFREKKQAQRNAVTNAVTDPPRNAVTNSAPYPTRPPTEESIQNQGTEGEEGVQGEPSRDAGAPAARRNSKVDKPPKPKGPDLAPLVEAFRALGMPDPIFSADEPKAAQGMLNYYTPQQIAACYQAYANHEWGDDYDWGRLSFRHLAGCQRVGNWLRDKDKPREERTKGDGGYSQRNHI